MLWFCAVLLMQRVFNIVTTVAVGASKLAED